MISKGHETFLKVPVPLVAQHRSNGTGLVRYSVAGIISFYDVYFPFLYNFQALSPQNPLMVSFHTLGVGNGFYLRESSQPIKQCKGICITSAYHPSPSKEELPATAAPPASAPWFPPPCSEAYTTQPDSEYLGRTAYGHRDR